MRRHFFVFFPVADTPSGFLYFHCSGLISKNLAVSRKNGEFSVFTFRDTKTADLPPNSPFVLCRGHTDSKIHNRLPRSSLRNAPPFRFGFADKCTSVNRLFRTEVTAISYSKASLFIEPESSDLMKKCTTIYHNSCVFGLAAMREYNVI